MAKILDYMLLACAIIAGAALFAFGARGIHAHAKSPSMRRFLLYVSIVLVFCGCKLGTVKPSPPTQPETPPVYQPYALPDADTVYFYPQDAMREWRALRAYWKHLQTIHPMKLTAEQLDDERDIGSGIFADLDNLAARRNITPETCAYLKQRIAARLQGPLPPEIQRDVLLREQWRQIQQSRDLLQPAFVHPWLFGVICEDIGEQFRQMKDAPLAQRCKALNMTKEEYARQVAELMVMLNSQYSNIIQNEESAIKRNEREPQPGPQVAYGVPDLRPELQAFTPDTMRLREVFEPASQAAILQAPEKLRVKKPSQAELLPAAKGMVLGPLDVLECDSEGDIEVALDDGRSVRLKSPFVLTRWEYDFRYSNEGDQP